MAFEDTPLKVGDRVKRYPMVIAGEDREKIGMVVEVSQSTPNGLGQSITMYAVVWGLSQTVEHGYLRNGLTKF